MGHFIIAGRRRESDRLLVDEPIVNQHFASLAQLDATIAERCRRLDAATIRPHTDFHWWPRSKKPN